MVARLTVALIAIAIALGSTDLAFAQREGEVVSLRCGEPISGVARGVFELQWPQYSIDVPDRATELQIILESTIEADIDMFINLGDPVDLARDAYIFDLALDPSKEGIWVFRDPDKPPLELDSDGAWIPAAEEDQRLQTGTYFIQIGNPEEADPNPWKLTATWWDASGSECATVPPILLSPNVPEPGRLTDPGFGNPRSDLYPEADHAQYAIEVGEGAQLLAIELKGEDGGNLDAYISFGPVHVTGSFAQADYALVSPDDHEVLILSNPRPGTYYIAVENLEESEQTFTVTALPLFAFETPDLSKEVTGEVTAEGGLLPLVKRFLQTQSGMLSLKQFKVDVPQGVKRLTVEVTGDNGANVNLHLRAGQPVEVRAGQVQADLSSISPLGAESVVIGGQLLRAGPWYIAVEGVGDLPQTFRVRITLDDGSGPRTASMTVRVGTGYATSVITLEFAQE